MVDMDDTELRELFEKKLDTDEVIYWTGEGRKKGRFLTKSKLFAITDKRVLVTFGRQTESIPFDMLRDATYALSGVKTEEDIMNLNEFYTVHYENGDVVFKDVDGIDTHAINCNNAREAFELIKKLCF